MGRTRSHSPNDHDRPFVAEGKTLTAWRRAVQPSLSQQEAADLIGVSLSTVNRWEGGKMLPDADKAEAIGETYRRSLSEVLALLRISGDGSTSRGAESTGHPIGPSSHSLDGDPYHRMFIVETWLRTLNVDPTGLSDPVATLQAEILKRGGARSLAEAAVIIDIVVGGERRTPRSNGHSHPRPRTNDAEHA